MSDLSSASGRAALKAQPGASPNVLLPVLWLAAAVAIGFPAIKGGVFDAMSTDDAMRLVLDGPTQLGSVPPLWDGQAAQRVGDVLDSWLERKTP